MNIKLNRKIAQYQEINKIYNLNLDYQGELFPEHRIIASNSGGRFVFGVLIAILYSMEDVSLFKIHAPIMRLMENVENVSLGTTLVRKMNAIKLILSVSALIPRASVLLATKTTSLKMVNASIDHHSITNTPSTLMTKTNCVSNGQMMGLA